MEHGINIKKKSQSPKQINSDLIRIQKNILDQVSQGRKFTMKDVSDELGMSEYNMNKILIKATGETVKTYISKCRREVYESSAMLHGDDSIRAQKIGVCLACRKTGVDLLQLSAKRIRLQ
ncbi:hypothetical protein [Dyadobacter arcticus]|uniref:AraC-like DNA-binding protein n=1 Tax=Dyadobacter arcticus TaxID=1078754 RepID=A0ABX0UMV9_9BACT|nr:hypothetical protein [Dyadobacter arcticus]NIJ53788.1 AraC-like DNA-binding protein [Dyadobacter arcticus]